MEFYSPYFKWKPAYAKDVRMQMDDLGLRCYSTHNGMESFNSDEGLAHAIENLRTGIGAEQLWKHVVGDPFHAFSQRSFSLFCTGLLSLF